MSGAPVALNEPPRAVKVDRVPRVPEPVVLKPEARLVASGLAVSLDDHAMKSGVTERCTLSLNTDVAIPAQSLEEHVVALGAVLDASKEAHRRVFVEVVPEHHHV